MYKEINTAVAMSADQVRVAIAGLQCEKEREIKDNDVIRPLIERQKEAADAAAPLLKKGSN